MDRLAGRLNTPTAELESRVEGLLEQNRSQGQELETANRRLARGEFEDVLSGIRTIKGASVLSARVDVRRAEGLREMADWFRDRVTSGAAVLATVTDGKPVMIATVTDDLIARGLKAGDLAREVAKIVGGNGGGRPNLAQAGGRDAEKLPEALDAVYALVEAALP